jgi:membrane-associated phospholipid phosphatase
MNGTANASPRLARRTGLRTGAAAGAAALLGGLSPGPAAAQATAAAGGPVEPKAGTWRPWLLTSGNQFRPPPPPDGAATDAELRELKALAGRRDAATLDRITFWDAGPAPYRWTETLIEWTMPPDLRVGLANGALFRAFALVTAAMHDATIAAWDAKYAYNRPRPTEQDPSLTAAVAVPRSPSYPSEHAAAAGAAAAVLGYLYPSDAERFAGMAQEAARSREEAGVQYPSDTAAGMDLGRKVAALAIERGQNDNSDATWDGTMPSGPGVWTGTNPTGVAERYWKPWVLASPDQLRPDPPPASDSEQLAAELAELKNFARTPRTNGLSLMWQYGSYGNPVTVVNWVRQASQKIMEGRMDADAPFATRLYSMLSVGLNDIWIANQDGKYAYWAIRPFQLDPSLTTVFPTPNNPSYPSNRSALGMATDLLAHSFPRDAALYQATGEQVAESAVWAGIHFRSDLVAGRALGRAVGQILMDRIKNDA